MFFSVVASKVKENANGARTFLEIVKVRFGTSAHLLFLVSIKLFTLLNTIELTWRGFRSFMHL